MTKLLPRLFALVCCMTLTAAACAAGGAVLSGESESLARTKIYNYVPLSSHLGRSARSDAVYCTVVERVYDDMGNLYQLADSSPLLEPGNCSLKTAVPVGGAYVDSITPAGYDKNGFTGSSFCLSLGKNYAGQNTVLEFETTYTALKDVTLRVIPLFGESREQTELLLQRGAKLSATCKLVLNETTTSPASYPDELPPYESLFNKNV